MTNKQACFPEAETTPGFFRRRSWFWGLALLVGLLLSWPAQGETLDDEYLDILNIIHQADALKAGERVEEALAKYRKAQAALLNFRKINPDWNNKVMNYRVNYLAEKLAPAPAPVQAAAAAVEKAPDSTEASAPPQAAKSAAAGLGPQVKLLQAGAEPRSVLRLHPKAGDKQALELTMTIGMGFQAGEMNNPGMKLPPIKMPVEVRVQSVSEEGDIAYELAVGEATLVEQAEAAPQAAGAAEVMKTSLAGIKGLTGSGTLSNRGFNKGSEMKVPAGVDAQARQAMEQTKEMFGQAAIPLPEEAVGAGAKWEVQLPLKSQGMTIHQTTTYELVSLQGERLTAKATVVQAAANQKVQSPAMPNLKVDLKKMSGRGTGDLTLELAKALPSAANIDSHTEMDMGMNMGGQKQSMTMKMDLNLRIDSK